MRKNVRYIIPFLLLSLAVAMLAASSMSAGNSAEKFTFVVFGDNRPSRSSLPQPTAFKRILKEINAHNPAFTVNTGDAIYGSSKKSRTQEQYKDYTETIASLLKAKVYLAIGNHEIHGSRSNQEFFAEKLGNLYYSFNHGDSHFIVLDSEYVGEAGKITGKQLEWLKDDLEKSRNARHKFVFFHRPMYPVDGHIGSSLDKYPKERDALHNLFIRNRINTVFAGHEHLLSHGTRNGVHYVITGGGGAPLYPSLKGEGDFYHYVVVSVNGDKVDMKAIKLGMRGKPDETIPLGSSTR